MNLHIMQINGQRELKKTEELEKSRMDMPVMSFRLFLNDAARQGPSYLHERPLPGGGQYMLLAGSRLLAVNKEKRPAEGLVASYRQQGVSLLSSFN